ncbi:MAG: DUF1849 family protein [Alphaproteobacteria bacterium]|jgi:hypothetical protein|nr:DUF1849 family protein [Alphaproteobacteria bacterium]MDP6588550.1 DUF1849 family protein [Alphaproteobacteria bacterium]MDP6817995.1 DUF1849 family protein [Alphaproteobacteria bacterium]
MLVAAPPAWRRLETAPAAKVTMKRKWAVILMLCLAAAGWLAAPVAGSAAEIWFTPHSGLYRMSLANAEASSGIIGASGEMYFEWLDACDGWNVNQHTSLILATSQDTNNQIGLTFSGWEAKDGMKLRFQASHFANGDMIDNIVGEASLAAAGGAGSVVYTKPDAHVEALPEGVLFPSEYSRRMMARMRAGKSGYTALMFDGASLEGIYEVSTVFAAPRMHAPPGAASDAGAEAAADEKVWPVRMAYFSLQGGDSEPDFEVGALINGFGVAHRYDIDYGNFAVLAVLENYEEIAPPDC